MKIKELLKKCTITPPNVVIYLSINKVEKEIELWDEDDFSNFIATYGQREVYYWAIDYIDGYTFVFFNVKG